MFSLIISIISIALVAALAAATVYFGGAAFNKGSAGADASTFINAGQQVAGAFTLASADGHTVTTVDKLTGDATETGGEVYLAQVPSYKGTEFVLDATDKSYVTVNVTSDQICEEINKRANGLDGTGKVIASASVTGLYGCVATGTKAFYKVL
jgi:hypothetical protein